MSRILLLPTLMMLLLAQGCATLSSAECRRSDWYRVGLTDALNGVPEARINQHADACADEGIVPNAAEYKRGREAGLLRYCTTSGGLSAGRKGQEYHWLCGEEKDVDFLVGYDLGKQIYQAQQRIRDVYYDIERREYLRHQSYVYDRPHRSGRRGHGHYGRHYDGFYDSAWRYHDGYAGYGHFSVYELTGRLTSLQTRLTQLLHEADHLLDDHKH